MSRKVAGLQVESWEVDQWAGCYPSNWKGEVVAEAMTHPAKSFFRRLAEKKGSPRIDWEVVWCMEKP